MVFEGLRPQSEVRPTHGRQYFYVPFGVATGTNNEANILHASLARLCYIRHSFEREHNEHSMVTFFKTLNKYLPDFLSPINK